MATRMLQRRGTAAEFAADNPVLADGEIGYERDTRVLKIGDGVTAWTALVSAWQTILPINAAGVGLTVQGRAAQAGDLQEWKDSAGTVKAWVTAAADLITRSSVQAWGYSTHGTNTRLGATSTSIVSVSTGAAGNEGITVKLFVGQGADALVVRDSTLALQLARITAMGGFHGHFSDGSATTALPGSSNTMSQGATNNYGLAVKKFAAATSDVFAVLDENNGVMFSVRADGLTGNAANGNYFNAPATNGVVMLTVTKAVGQVGHIIRGFLGQTGDMLQVQDSTNAILAKIMKDGDTQVPFFSVGGTRVGGALASFLSNATGTVPMVVRGFAAATADRTQWTSSLNVTELAVDKNGHLAGRGTAPVATVQPALGTSPPAPTVVGSDQGCVISFGTGTAPAAGFGLRLTFNRPYSAIGGITITPQGSAAAGLGVPYIVGASATNVDIGFPNAPAASQAVGTYKYNVVVIGN